MKERYSYLTRVHDGLKSYDFVSTWRWIVFDYIKELYEKVGRVEFLEKIEDQTSIRRREITKVVVRSLVQTASIANILEIGPASGYITRGICEVIEDKNGVILDILDFSNSYIETTRRRGLRINKAHVADINSIDFDAVGQYDLVLCQEVIEHLTCPFVAVSNINELLVEGGYLFLTLPNALYFRTLLGAINLTKIKKNVNLKDTHIAELSVPGVIKLLSMSGFEIRSVFYYGSKIPVVDALLSPQVGFLAQKISHPKECWKALEATLLKKWDNKNV